MKIVRCFVCVLFCSICSNAQTLTIGAVSGLPGTIVRVPMTLSGVVTPLAGLQWTIKYAKTISIVQSAGPVAVAANKQLNCLLTVTTINQDKCMLNGINTNVINNGIVAYLDVSLPAGFSGTAGIAISGTLGASSTPVTAIPVSGVSGKVYKASTITSYGLASTNGKMLKANAKSSDDSISCWWKDEGAVCKINVQSDIGGIWLIPFSSRDDLFEQSIPVLVHGSSEVLFKLIENKPIAEQIVLGVTFGNNSLSEIMPDR